MSKKHSPDTARISIELGDLKWLRLLKAEAQETQQSMDDIVLAALDAYFQHRMEIKAMMKSPAAPFEGWNPPLEK